MENKKENTGLLTKKPWLDCLIFVIGAFVISFVFYLIFSSWQPSPDITLYDQSASYSTLSSAASSARTFVSNLNYTWTYVVGWVLMIALVIVALVLFKKKKMSWRIGLLFIILIGVIVRLIYTNTTDNIFTRQYDVWSSYGKGHYAITMHIYEDWTLPDLRNGTLDDSYQMYHPKLAHYVYAIVMHINSVFFGTSDAQWTLYQSIRIFTCALSIIQIYISYLIMRELFTNMRSVFFGTLFLSCSPLLIRMSAGSNNDPLLYFFLFLSVLFAIRFYKRNGWGNIIGCAISIGCAMASKLSGALIAFPIGALFVYKFVREIIDAEKGNKLKTSGKFILYYVVFLVICAPIGLYWPIYNYINYGQSLTYVWHNLNQALLIPEEYTYADRYLYFSFRTYFSSVFHIGWNTSEWLLDYNTYADLLKSSVFGEYSFTGVALVFAVVLYAVNFIIAFACLFIYIYIIMKYLLKKKFDVPVLLALPAAIYLGIVLFNSDNIFGQIIAVILFAAALAGVVYIFINHKRFTSPLRLATIFFMIMFMTFLISYITFQFEYPYTCTHDFRYVGMFLVCFAFVIGVLLDKTETKRSYQKVIEGFIWVYAICSFGLYSSIAN